MPRFACEAKDGSPQARGRDIADACAARAAVRSAGRRRRAGSRWVAEPGLTPVSGLKLEAQVSPHEEPRRGLDGRQ